MNISNNSAVVTVSGVIVIAILTCFSSTRKLKHLVADLSTLSSYEMSGRADRPPRF